MSCELCRLGGKSLQAMDIPRFYGYVYFLNKVNGRYVYVPLSVYGQPVLAFTNIIVTGIHPAGNRPNGIWPNGNRPNGNRPNGNRPNGNRPNGNRPNGNRPNGNRQNGNRQNGNRQNGNRPNGNRPNGNRRKGNQPNGNQPNGNRRKCNQPNGNQSNGNRPNGNRPNGNRPNGNRPNGNRPNGNRPNGNRPNGSRPNGIPQSNLQLEPRMASLPPIHHNAQTPVAGDHQNYRLNSGAGQMPALSTYGVVPLDKRTDAIWRPTPEDQIHNNTKMNQTSFEPLPGSSYVTPSQPANSHATEAYRLAASDVVDADDMELEAGLQALEMRLIKEFEMMD